MAQHLRDFALIDLGKKRESDAERIKRHGWDPFVTCAWCGDTGMIPDTQAECFCEVGTDRLTKASRELHWINIAPKRFRDYALDNHPNKVLAEAVGAWLDGDPLTTGENLVIQGGTGRGKTGAAIGAIREFHFRGKTVRYWSLPDLMDQLRSEEFERSNPQAVIDSLRKKPTMSYLTDCDCLLLDDMGTERPTKYVEDRIYIIVNQRYTNGLPTIITTNWVGKRFHEYLGERVASRINESARYISAAGPDLRVVR